MRKMGNSEVKVKRGGKTRRKIRERKRDFEYFIDQTLLITVINTAAYEKCVCV